MELRSEEPIYGSIKRIARELNASSVEALKSAVGNEHEVIHNVRKNLKQMRGLLRLVRDELGDEVYNLENMHYRDVGREISEIRDATSVIGALEKLKELYKDELMHVHYISLKEQLVKKRDIMEEELLYNQKVLEQVESKLRRGEERIEKWFIADKKFETIKPGLRKVYAQGYDLMQNVPHHPVTAQLHEWRKQVKYLMYHIRMLMPVWPEVLITLEAEINRLTDYLGDDHDLALLEEKITASELGDEGNVLFNTMTGTRRKELQHRAFVLGNKIYAVNPYDYVNQFEAFWQSWTNERKISSGAD